MRTFLARLLAVASVILGLQALPAAAQGFPPGSYQATCKQIHWAGSTLVAECQRRDGRFTGTGLPNAARCAGEIFNDDGQLRCGHAAAPGGPPPGYGAPGYGAPGSGYGGYDERRAHCEELRQHQHEIRERLQLTPWGSEREHLEYRLREIHEERERLGCG